MGKGRSREIKKEAITIQRKDEGEAYQGRKKGSDAGYIFSVMHEISYHIEKELEK